MNAEQRIAFFSHPAKQHDHSFGDVASHLHTLFWSPPTPILGWTSSIKWVFMEFSAAVAKSTLDEKSETEPKQ